LRHVTFQIEISEIADELHFADAFNLLWVSFARADVLIAIFARADVLIAINDPACEVMIRVQCS
jgi:hypothetical protein